MAADREPKGSRRTAWNVGIILLVVAILILLGIALIGGGGTQENEEAMIAPLVIA